MNEGLHKTLHELCFLLSPLSPGGLLEWHIQMPTQEPLAVHWHTSKGFFPFFLLFFLFFSPFQKGECPWVEGGVGEQRAQGG